MQRTIYGCDFCGIECDPDMMLHYESDGGWVDVCESCLTELVKAELERRATGMTAGTTAEATGATETPQEAPETPMASNQPLAEPRCPEMASKCATGENTKKKRPGVSTELSDADIEAIMAARAAGTSHADIAKKYHIGLKRVCQICAGVKKGEKAQRTPKPAGASIDYKKAQALRNNSWSLEAIAAEVGASVEAVRKHTAEPKPRRPVPAHEWTGAAVEAAL